MIKNNTEFSNDERIAAFKRIEQNFYNRNFGTMSKPDFETLIFDIYITHLLDTNENFDDYTMSKSLGISQSRIRSLKAKKELRYPRDSYNWMKAFADCTRRITYDETTRKISFVIEDINVQTDLRYYMETRGWFDEYQLNPKVFTCKTDFFVKLCAELSGSTSSNLDDTSRASLAELEKEYSGSESDKSALKTILDGAFEDGMKSLLLNGSKMLIVEVLKIIPFGGIASSIITNLIDIIAGNER